MKVPLSWHFFTAGFSPLPFRLSRWKHTSLGGVSLSITNTSHHVSFLGLVLSSIGPACIHTSQKCPKIAFSCGDVTHLPIIGLNHAPGRHEHDILPGPVVSICVCVYVHTRICVHACEPACMPHVNACATACVCVRACVSHLHASCVCLTHARHCIRAWRVHARHAVCAIRVYNRACNRACVRARERVFTLWNLLPIGSATAANATHTCTSSRAHSHRHTRACTHMHICTCTCIQACACARTHSMHVCTHLCAYACPHMHTHACTRAH